MTTLKRFQSVLLSLCVLVTAGSSGWAATKSVEEFLALRGRWEKLTGRKMVIEGRVSSMTGTTVILQKCSRVIEFRSQREVPSATGSDVAEVTGTLERDEKTNKIYFAVSQVKLLPTDVQRVAIERGNLPKDSSVEWYALGDWAINRAKFYDKADDPLYKKATAIFQQAVGKERRQLNPRTPEGLRGLAVKARRYGVDSSIHRSLVHESYVIEWQSIRLDAESANQLGLATALAGALPGGGDALAVNQTDQAIKTKYLDDPLKFYEENTADSLRRKLHRFLYQHIVTEVIRKEHKADGSNGKVIAKIIKEYLPERIDEVEKHISAERMWRLTKVAGIRRAEMLELRKEFLDLGDKGNAAKALDSWFTHREDELRKRGVDGLLDLATEFELRHELTDDKAAQDDIHKKLIAVLMEAYRKNPGWDTTRKRLEGYGYHLSNGVWKTPEQMERFRNTPRQKAMAEGRVVEGMTGDEVVKSLGKPDRVTRILTARSVIELWSYGNSDAVPLVVRLVRTGNRKISVVSHWKQLAVNSIKDSEPEEDETSTVSGEEK